MQVIQQDKDLINIYKQYIAGEKAKRPKQKSVFDLVRPVTEQNLAVDVIQKEAGTTDAAIITIGRNAGEGADRKVENDFTLTAVESDLIKNVSEAFHAKGKKSNCCFKYRRRD